MGSDSDDESVPLSKVSRKSSTSDTNQRSALPRRTAAAIARTQMLESDGKTDHKSSRSKSRDYKTKQQKPAKSKTSKQNEPDDNSSSNSGDSSDDDTKRKTKENEDDESKEEEEDDDDDVEDPDKLYCICRKPYNKEYFLVSLYEIVFYHW